MTEWPSDTINQAIHSLGVQYDVIRRRAEKSIPVPFTTYSNELLEVHRYFHICTRNLLMRARHDAGFPKADLATVLSTLDVVSENVALALPISDHIVKAASCSGSYILEMVHKANEMVYPHMRSYRVEGIDDEPRQNYKDFWPWSAALERIKYYQDMRITLDDFL